MTNQASEDELIKSKTDWSTSYDEWLIPTLNRFRYGGAIECRAIPSEIQLNIEAIVRTEKLKLLAEVRERVIEQAKPDKRKATSWQQGIEVAAYEDAVRVYEYKMNEQLTKLEAEL